MGRLKIERIKGVFTVFAALPKAASFFDFLCFPADS